MNRLDVWKFALAAAVTFAALSAVCAVAVIVSPDAHDRRVQQLVSRSGLEAVGAAWRQAGHFRPGYLRRDQRCGG